MADPLQKLPDPLAGETVHVDPEPGERGRSRSASSGSSMQSTESSSGTRIPASVTARQKSADSAHHHPERVGGVVPRTGPDHLRRKNPLLVHGLDDQRPHHLQILPVSYTHLTLPTTLWV